MFREEQEKFEGKEDYLKLLFWRGRWYDYLKDNRSQNIVEIMLLYN